MGVVMTAYSSSQKRMRLQTDIEHFAGRLRSLSEPTTPQQKRQRTIAGRCLQSRVRDMLALDAKTPRN
jgi:hypothetical protein